MLNLNLNIIGGGIQKNKSDFDSTMVINFDQTSSAILNLNVVGTASLGFLGDKTFEKNYVSTQSAEPLDTFNFDRSSQVKITLSGSGDWGVLQDFPTSPSSSISLVTMSLEVPYFAVSASAFGTGSVIDVDFSASISRQVYDVNSFVNIDNPTLLIDYLVVGGGGAGQQGPYGVTGGNGGEAGEFKTGSVILQINDKLAISGSAGAFGDRGVCPGGPDTPFAATAGVSSSLFITGFNPDETIALFASGGRAGNYVQSETPENPNIGARRQNPPAAGECGSEPKVWLDGRNYSWGGNGGVYPSPDTNGCPIAQVPSQGTSNRPGFGGNGGDYSPSTCTRGESGGPGVSVIRFYNPNNVITVSGSAERVNDGDYTYLYFKATETVELSFPNQKYPAL
jgi:hypothetical protein